jgi:hypothetical protein
MFRRRDGRRTNRCQRVRTNVTARGTTERQPCGIGLGSGGGGHGNLPRGDFTSPGALVRCSHAVQSSASVASPENAAICSAVGTGKPPLYARTMSDTSRSRWTRGGSSLSVRESAPGSLIVREGKRTLAGALLRQNRPVHQPLGLRPPLLCNCSEGVLHAESRKPSVASPR